LAAAVGRNDLYLDAPTVLGAAIVLVEGELSRAGMFVVLRDLTLADRAKDAFVGVIRPDCERGRLDLNREVPSLVDGLEVDASSD